jgi:hypothetical protein
MKIIHHRDTEKTFFECFSSDQICEQGFGVREQTFDTEDTGEHRGKLLLSFWEFLSLCLCDSVVN